MMHDIVFVLATAVACCGLGVALQVSANRLIGSRLGTDEREFAVAVGFRIGAVFSIVVGLIVNSSFASYSEARRDLLEETRLIGLAYMVAGAFESEAKAIARTQLQAYLATVAEEIRDQTEGSLKISEPDGKLLEACNVVVGNGQGTAAAWSGAEFGRLCSKLVELRSKRRVLELEQKKESYPLWGFLIVSFVALAILLGTFPPSSINRGLGALFYVSAGMTFALIFGMSSPYSGPAALDSTPLLQMATFLARL